MATSYLRREMTEPATFSLFARALPPSRGFLVAAGLDDVLRLLADYGFDDDDLAWLAGQGFDTATLDALRGLRFTGDVLATRSEPAPNSTTPLLAQAMREGERLGPVEPTAVAAERLSTDLAQLPLEALELKMPRAVRVRVSERLEALTKEVRDLHRPVTAGRRGGSGSVAWPQVQVEGRAPIRRRCVDVVVHPTGDVHATSGGGRLLRNAHASGAHLIEGPLRGVRGDAGDHRGQDPDRQSVGRGVHRGGLHAVVGGEADDVDGVDPA